jgi:rubrerythrin
MLSCKSVRRVGQLFLAQSIGLTGKIAIFAPTCEVWLQRRYGGTGTFPCIRPDGSVRFGRKEQLFGGVTLKVKRKEIDMKRIMLFVSTAALMVCLSACGTKDANKQAAASDEQEALTPAEKDLEAAADGEATASAKYAAFAAQAAKEGLPQIEALYMATSKAESIHLANHQKALREKNIMGYKPKVGHFEVKTTAENLKASIEGESYESATMYPNFIKDAKGEYEDTAVKSFQWAWAAEKNHAKLYAAALANINNPKKLARVYYVCPTCGNVYDSKQSSDCEICKTPAYKFLKFAAK